MQNGNESVMKRLRNIHQDYEWLYDDFEESRSRILSRLNIHSKLCNRSRALIKFHLKLVSIFFSKTWFAVIRSRRPNDL